MLYGKNNNDLTIRDRLSRLEGKVTVLQVVNLGTFAAVMGMLLARALGG